MWARVTTALVQAFRYRCKASGMGNERIDTKSVYYIREWPINYWTWYSPRSAEASPRLHFPHSSTTYLTGISNIGKRTDLFPTITCIQELVSNRRPASAEIRNESELQHSGFSTVASDVLDNIVAITLLQIVRHSETHTYRPERRHIDLHLKGDVLQLTRILLALVRIRLPVCQTN